LAIAGPEGQLGVYLAHPAYVEEFTIDHVAKDVRVGHALGTKGHGGVGVGRRRGKCGEVREWKEEKGRQRHAARREAEEKGVEFVEEEECIRRRCHAMWSTCASRHSRTTFTRRTACRRSPFFPDVKELDVDFGLVVLKVKSNWGRVCQCG